MFEPVNDFCKHCCSSVVYSLKSTYYHVSEFSHSVCRVCGRIAADIGNVIWDYSRPVLMSSACLFITWAEAHELVESKKPPFYSKQQHAPEDPHTQSAQVQGIGVATTPGPTGVIHNRSVVNSLGLSQVASRPVS